MEKIDAEWMYGQWRSYNYSAKEIRSVAITLKLLAERDIETQAP